MSKLLFVVLLSVILSGCGFDKKTYDPAIARSIMEENKAKWNGQRIRNYHIAENVGCFCPITHNVIIMVSDSVLIHVEPNTNLGEDPTQIALSLYSFYKTIDELFSEIDSAITNGVDNLTVEYDSDLGYPTFIDVDPISSGVDDEYSYKISLLEIY